MSQWAETRGRGGAGQVCLENIRGVCNSDSCPSIHLSNPRGEKDVIRGEKSPSGRNARPPVRTQVRPPVRTQIQPQVQPQVQEFIPYIQPQMRPPVRPPVQPPVRPPVRTPVQPLVRPPVQPPVRTQIQPPVRPPVQEFIPYIVPPVVQRASQFRGKAKALSYYIGDLERAIKLEEPLLPAGVGSETASSKQEALQVAYALRAEVETMVEWFLPLMEKTIREGRRSVGW